MKRADILIIFSVSLILLLIISVSAVTYTARNAALGDSGTCKKGPVLLKSDLTGTETIKITNIKGSICSRSWNGLCEDSTGCASGFKHGCSGGTQGTVGLYNSNNKKVATYSIAQVMQGVKVPSTAKKAYVYFLDTWYNDNNGGFKCTFDFSSCAPECSGKECGDDGCGGSCGSCSGTTSKCKTSTGQCVTCLDNTDCNGGKICNSNNCVNPEDPCASKNCDDNEPCTQDSCSSGNCINTLISCPSGQTCNNGACVPIFIAGNATWQNLNSIEIQNADIYDTVKLALNQANLLNKEINYSIYKKDGAGFLFWFWDKKIAQFSSIGFSTWIINETGEFYFNASVEDYNNNYSSNILVVGEEFNAKPTITIIKPVENSTFVIGTDRYTNDVIFEQNASDEDDIIDIYWNFDDRNTIIFTDCNNGINNCNTTHRYTSAFAGTRIINATAKEATRKGFEYDLSRIYVYKEGLNLFIIIDKPNYKLREFPQTPITLDARSTHIANCSRTLDICQASAGGKTCSEITDSIDVSDKLYCYKYADSSSNKFRFTWYVDGITKPNYPTDASPFQIVFPQGGKHDIELNARFTI